MGGGNVELPKDGSQGQDRQSGVGEALHCYINQSRSPCTLYHLLPQALSSAFRGRMSDRVKNVHTPLKEREPSRDLVDC